MIIEKLSDTIELEENLLPCLTYTKANERHDRNQYIYICNVGIEFDDDI